MMKREYPHNSPEQTRDYLEAALQLVEDLDPPADLREAVFNHAVSLTSAKQIVYEQPGAAVDLGPLAARRH